MATKSASPEVSGARKRKLSNKASTNGDPLEAQKQNKTLSAVKKGVTAALTKKKKTAAVSSSKTATITSKVAAAAPNRASEKVAGKGTQKCATVEDVDDADDADERTSNPPQNPNHILEAVDGSDNLNGSDPGPPEVISVNNSDEESDDETNLEAAEESRVAKVRFGSILQGFCRT
jgi:hypothetical protein